MANAKVRILFDIDEQERLVPFFLDPEMTGLTPNIGSFSSIAEAKGFLIGMGVSDGVADAGGWQKIFEDGEQKAAAQEAA